jgi:deoxyribodipyrimidine photo-lyase
MRPIIVWFRRDLRIRDNAALYHASLESAPIIPLFIVDEDIIRALPSDGAVFNFQAGALRELATSLTSLGGSLILRSGRASDLHKSLINELNPSALYFNRDYEPVARDRDDRITRLYISAGINVRTFKDHVIHEPGEVLTDSGKPYVVFTPYARSWKKQELAQPCGIPQRITTPPLSSAPIPDAISLGKPTTISSPGFSGGESSALTQWERFLTEKINGYATTRDIPGMEGTSRISPFLRFGCISPRQLVHDLHALPTQGEGSAKFLDELLWREFYQSVLWHFPRLTDSSFRQEFDALEWSRNDSHFEAWKIGATGYPLVDAGMRQLNTTGWMHNRIRMVTASFLTKDLMQNWRRGEKYFASRLMDCETASNNGGWQWAASTGVDPRPLRIFNPSLQAERFDQDGSYIRMYCPELRNVPDQFIHAPHTMPAVLQREVGVVIGRDYPVPIVDHAVAASAYKRAFAAVKQKNL